MTAWLIPRQTLTIRTMCFSDVNSFNLSSSINGSMLFDLEVICFFF
jgi:hypothetical protein